MQHTPPVQVPWLKQSEADLQAPPPGTLHSAVEKSHFRPLQQSESSEHRGPLPSGRQHLPPEHE
jgi:hypothetical protein